MGRPASMAASVGSYDTPPAESKSGPRAAGEGEAGGGGGGWDARGLSGAAMGLQDGQGPKTRPSHAYTPCNVLVPSAPDFSLRRKVGKPRTRSAPASRSRSFQTRIAD